MHWSIHVFDVRTDCSVLNITHVNACVCDIYIYIYIYSFFFLSFFLSLFPLRSTDRPSGSWSSGNDDAEILSVW